MTLTIALMYLIFAGLFAYILFDDLIVRLLKGKTVLSVRLRKRNYLDQLILATLLVIIYISNNVRGESSTVINTALILLVLTLLYNTFVKVPTARFKKTGFFYGLGFIKYDQVKKMNLSEDGVLVVDTSRRRMLLYARKIDDLEKILNVFATH
ncbi:DUF986 family protein [Sporolactobacillus nakayamae]|uniref:UPF0266 membrane protein YobD n=1 Tax=Sporolactobacillus nakayamae TaxID=269670 RepID=A0A1I2VV96_9BACL|nr:DUF986 family protein [Sporolactobacillus nakayamae]SFG91141.1 Uncharacterized membrane protein YobD, UPF0266 family [Sporolactobacillus nakayamae]